MPSSALRWKPFLPLLRLAPEEIGTRVSTSVPAFQKNMPMGLCSPRIKMEPPINMNTVASNKRSAWSLISAVAGSEVVGLGLPIGTDVRVGDGDADGLALGDAVGEGEAVGVGVAVGLAVGVGDGVPVAIGVLVGVTVGVNVGVDVGVNVGVGVGVAVSTGKKQVEVVKDTTGENDATPPVWLVCNLAKYVWFGCRLVSGSCPLPGFQLESIPVIVVWVTLAVNPQAKRSVEPLKPEVSPTQRAYPVKFPSVSCGQLAVTCGVVDPVGQVANAVIEEGAAHVGEAGLVSLLQTVPEEVLVQLIPF